MNTGTAGLEIYHTLVRAGLEDDVADDLAKQIVTRSEIEDVMVTESRLTAVLHENTKWLIGVFIGIAFGQLAVTLTVVAMMFNFYLG